MIESPLLTEFEEKIRKKVSEQTRVTTRQEDLITFLEGRFNAVPADIASLIRGLSDEARLSALSRVAGKCPDLDAFRAQLTAATN